MKKMLLASAALIAIVFSAPAFAVDGEDLTDEKPTHAEESGYETVAACLGKISVQHDGKTYHMREGVHFRPYGSDDPDVVLAGGVSLVAGIRSHKLWKTKIGEIENCLDEGNLKYVGRSD